MVLVQTKYKFIISVTEIVCLTKVFSRKIFYITFIFPNIIYPYLTLLFVNQVFFMSLAFLLSILVGWKKSQNALCKQDMLKSKSILKFFRSNQYATESNWSYKKNSNHFVPM